jgi:sugar phosphate isomerase/epimerase
MDPFNKKTSHGTQLVSRRNLLRGAAFSVGALASRAAWTPQAAGIDPPARFKPGKLRLSMAAYSVRDLLQQPDSGWDLLRFVDYCLELGLEGAELTSYYFPKSVDEAYLARLRMHCHRRGISISGGAIANDFCQMDPTKVKADIDHTKRWIDRYAILGAPVIRIFAGGQPDGESWSSTLVRCAATIDEVAQYAAQRGIYLGLENHGGVTSTANQMLEIVKRVQSDGLGVNLDSGNFRSSRDPYAELEQIAPYAVNAQLKVEMFPDGVKEWTDIPRVLRILANSGYSGFVALEYEASDPPLEAIPGWVERMKAGLSGLNG